MRMVDFSQRINQLRKDKHMTQAQVAARIGVTASMVSSYETDIRLPSYAGLHDLELDLAVKKVGEG